MQPTDTQITVKSVVASSFACCRGRPFPLRVLVNLFPWSAKGLFFLEVWSALRIPKGCQESMWCWLFPLSDMSGKASVWAETGKNLSRFCSSKASAARSISVDNTQVFIDTLSKLTSVVFEIIFPSGSPPSPDISLCVVEGLKSLPDTLLWMDVTSSCRICLTELGVYFFNKR